MAGPASHVPRPSAPLPAHPRFSRRFALQAGGLGLVGLGMNHLAGLRALAAPHDPAATRPPRARSVIYIFLSGGLAQHDSFDMKPEAPDTVRGEFRPIATATPGLQICEHLPRLAQQSARWSIVRSMAHRHPEHSAGHHIMLTGRSLLPPGFDPGRPRPQDEPSIASIVGSVCGRSDNIPPAVALPETLIHRTGRVLPGQFGGLMGSQHDPLFLNFCQFNGKGYGAYPTHTFHHAEGPNEFADYAFEAPALRLPEGLTSTRLDGRLALLEVVDRQRATLDRVASGEPFDRHRQRAISLLTDARVRRAFDVSSATPEDRGRYGENSFGWSLLIARQLVEAGVALVQVNLGNNESWDTHGNAFPNLKNYLMPPMDQAVSALVDDLADRGLLDETLLVMAGEMGRTPRVSTLSGVYAGPGRDHWGTQTVWFAGGGIQGGRVIGSTDKIGAYPASDPQTPESMAATIYSALGIPRELAWHDASGRPHFVYHGDPIGGLTA